MALKLYYWDEAEDEYIEVSEVLPIITSHEGKNGDWQVRLLALKRDNANSYTNGIIDLTDTSPDYSTTGWGVKLKIDEGSAVSKAEWDSIDWGNQIKFSLIDDDNYWEFWYLVSCPPNTSAQNKLDIELEVSYTEYLP